MSVKEAGSWVAAGITMALDCSALLWRPLDANAGRGRTSQVVHMGKVPELIAR